MFWESNFRGAVLSLGLFAIVGVSVVTGCKNALRGTLSDEQLGPESTVDYSYVKYATYREGRVLSAGEYLGHPDRAEVLERAEQDLVEARQKRCGVGSTSSFCLQDEGEPVEWIQLFMPDGRSCYVGQPPQDFGISPCI